MLLASRVPARDGTVPTWLRRSVHAAFFGCALVLQAPLAYAAQDQVDDLVKLLEQGKAAQAARQVDGYLKQNPGDVQMRFMQGVIAAEQKQNAQAIKVFTALTRDYPNLPEPYNNLAVLYAADGQERKASEVLEQAIRTNPSYATAHENLGDLYARMASSAYSKALQLDEGRQAIQPKLSLITQIFHKQPASTKTAATPTAAPASAPAKTVDVASSVAMADARAAAKPVTTALAESPKTESVKPVAVAAATEAGRGAKPSAGPKPAEPKSAKAAAPEAPVAKKAHVDATSGDRGDAKRAVAEPAKPDIGKTAASAAHAEIESAVRAWAAAWAGQDMGKYLGAYSEKFVPADGSSLAQWKEIRRQRIVGKGSISVTLRDVKLSTQGDTATAHFRQAYVSGALRTTTRKTLMLQREHGLWRITRETTGS